jgi:hypothetical protein
LRCAIIGHRSGSPFTKTLGAARMNYVAIDRTDHGSSDMCRCSCPEEGALLYPVIDRALLVLDRPKGEIMLKQFVMTVAATVLVGLSLVAAAADTVVVIVSHEVADFAAWKKGFDAGKGNRDKAGFTARYVMRDVDKPNFVTVVLESGSLENAKKFVSEIKERIKKSAVIVGAPDIKIGTTGAVEAKK